jgi:hypothetical protein
VTTVKKSIIGIRKSKSREPDMGSLDVERTMGTLVQGREERYDREKAEKTCGLSWKQALVHFHGEAQ